MRRTTMAFGLLATIVLGSCGERDKSVVREERLSEALKDNRQGPFGSAAVWLVKNSEIAGAHRTAVFFGYADNLTACMEIADSYNTAHNETLYVCSEMDR